MLRVTKSLLAVLCLLSFMSLETQAAVLGNSVLGVSVGEPDSGDYDIYGVSLRLAADQDVSFIAGLGFADSNDFDSESMTISIGGQVHRMESETFNPFFGAEFVWATVESGSGAFKTDDDDVGAQVGGGLEINLAGSFSVIGSATYINIFRDEELVLGASANLWLGDVILLTAGAGYAIDTKTVTISVGLGIGLDD